MKIEEQSNDVFKITVSGHTTTLHEVTVTDSALQELTNGQVTKEELLDFSFKFLLDREPNTSILSSFEIMVIAQYFHEYPPKVQEWCAK